MKRIKHTNSSQVPLLFSTTKFNNQGNRPLPSLFDVPSQQRSELFILKLNYCENIFQLSPNALVPKISEIIADDRKDKHQKNRGSGKFTKIMPKIHSKIEVFDECDEKEKCLEDILRYLATSSGNNKYLFTEECYAAMVSMTRKNIFRCPPLRLLKKVSKIISVLSYKLVITLKFLLRMKSQMMKTSPSLTISGHIWY